VKNVVTVQDIILTMSVGSLMFLFIVGTFGGYSDSASNILDQHNSTLTNLHLNSTGLTETARGSGSDVTYEDSSDNALASALGGIATSTISIAQLLLISLWELPITFLEILFDITYEATVEVAPEQYHAIPNMLFEIAKIVVTTLIVFGILFKIILSKQDTII
jgi:hypothetical protein